LYGKKMRELGASSSSQDWSLDLAKLENFKLGKSSKLLQVQWWCDVLTWSMQATLDQYGHHKCNFCYVGIIHQGNMYTKSWKYQFRDLI
jgi:hypothetical protein